MWRIHMKYQVLFSLKNNEKIPYLWMSSAAVMISALRINEWIIDVHTDKYLHPDTQCRLCALFHVKDFSV